MSYDGYHVAKSENRLKKPQHGESKDRKKLISKEIFQLRVLLPGRFERRTVAGVPDWNFSMYTKATSEHPPERPARPGPCSIIGVISHPEQDIQYDEDFKVANEHAGYEWLWDPD